MQAGVFSGSMWEILRGFEGGDGMYAVRPVPTTKQSPPC